jgi:hypothetical protein
MTGSAEGDDPVELRLKVDRRAQRSASSLHYQRDFKV